MSHELVHHKKEIVWMVRHALPGRVRFYGPALRGDHRLAHGIRTALRKLPGLESVGTNTASGSVLVRFNPEILSEATILEAIHHAHRSHNRWDDSLEAREVDAIQSVGQMLAWCDSRVRSYSGGKLGLRQLAIFLMTGNAFVNISEAGLLSLEVIQSSFEVLLAWILFKHPRLEREFQQVEVYVTPGL